MTDLDDFFAKKDKGKKKNKAKSKLTPADLLAQQEKSDDSSTGESTKKDKKKDKTEDQTKTTKTQEDEEWIDFEHEGEKDYTGLRIQNLQISKTTEEELEYQENKNEELDEYGEKKDKSSGPWAQQHTAPPIREPQPESKPQPVTVKDETVNAGKYVPPSMRGLTSSQQSLRTGPYRKKKTAPNIHDAEAFPTLGGASPSPGDANRSSEDSSFERVRSGGSYRQQDDSTAIELGNRYQSLDT